MRVCPKIRFEDEVFENANEEDLDRDIKVDAENPIYVETPPLSPVMPKHKR